MARLHHVFQARSAALQHLQLSDMLLRTTLSPTAETVSMRLSRALESTKQWVWSGSTHALTCRLA